MTEMCIQWHSITSLQMMGQYENSNVPWQHTISTMPLNMNVVNHDALNRIKIHLKTQLHTIPASRFIVEHTPLKGLLLVM